MSTFTGVRVTTIFETSFTASRLIGTAILEKIIFAVKGKKFRALYVSGSSLPW
jgi:hypothetical protein